MTDHPAEIGRLLSAYVDSFAEEHAKPVVAARDAAITDLRSAEAEIESLRARIDELENPRRPFIFAAEAKPRPGEPTDTAGYVMAYKRLETSLARHGGTLDGFHSFSGTATLPFGSGGTNAVHLALGGTTPVVNAKTPNNDLRNVPSGRYDAGFLALCDSWPRDRGGYLTMDHEASNPSKGIAPADYRAAWAHYARLFLSHPVSQTVTFASVGMGFDYEPASGRNPDDWNPLPLLSDEERTRVVLAADIYFKATDSAERGWAIKAKPFFDYVNARGYRSAIFETALNNDSDQPPHVVGPILEGLGAYMRAEPSLELVAFYEATGPAAGTNAWVDTSEEEAALATWTAPIKTT